MFDPSSFADPTPLAHADTSRDVLPRGAETFYFNVLEILRTITHPLSTEVRARIAFNELDKCNAVRNAIPPTSSLKIQLGKDNSSRKDVPSWKYPRNLEIAQSVISRFWQGFQDDGNVIDVTAQVAPELQRRMRTGIWQLLTKIQTEHSVRPVPSALFGYRYDSFKADRVQTLRAHWSICS
ncbi:uncharacterized protein TNCV_329011 [Trichonephila clavipes]|nr:uncharacterized protein TNCV_329011 [Trichonephila clavipes]